MARVRERSRPVVVAEAPQKEDKAGYRRYIELTYQLIEYKIMYYYPELIKEGFHPGLEISDDAYDALEIEYLTICQRLGLQNTVVHKTYADLKVEGPGMFEVDFTRPVVHLVLRKYGVKDWQHKCRLDSDEVPNKKYFEHVQRYT